MAMASQRRQAGLGNPNDICFLEKILFICKRSIKIKFRFYGVVESFDIFIKAGTCGGLKI
jgi:hypothetical protein